MGMHMQTDAKKASEQISYTPCQCGSLGLSNALQYINVLMACQLSMLALGSQKNNVLVKLG